MLGVKPLLGRFFGPEDDKPDAHPVVVIGHAFWQTRFAADPNVVGKAVKINGFPFTIIGVAPASFQGTELIVTSAYWAPMSMEREIEPGNDWLGARGSQQVWAIGRLKRGVSQTQAEANLDQIAKQIARAYPNDLDVKAKFHLSRPGLVGEALRGPITGFGVVLMSVAGIVLLLACVNLAGMLLARASDRHREFGIRLALGASRLQLLRQLLTESLLLAAIGGLLGLAIAFTACRLFSSWQPGFDLPISTELRPNSHVLWFTLAVALLTTLLFGLTPALHAVESRVRRWTMRDFLVAGQIALSLILVVSSRPGCPKPAPRPYHEPRLRAKRCRLRLI
jgi:predicted permease